ncbi:MAG: OmpA family protein [Mesorhizobium sp.]
MKIEKRKISLALCAVAATGMIACGSTQTKDSGSLGDGVVVNAANEQLAKIPVVGFPPFGTQMPITQFDKYGENAATVAKTVVSSMPEGYLLQVVGHANQHASKSEAYTKSLSTQRAKYVYNYFAAKGIEKKKMTYTGVGNAEPDANLSHSDNRRVTFKLIKK